MQDVTVDKAKSAMEDTQKKLDEVLIEDPLTQQIVEMKNEQARLKKEKQELRRRLKNAENRRSRLKKKARMLTDEDLVHVMMWRKESKEKKNAGEAEAAEENKPVQSDVFVSRDDVDHADP